MLTRKAFLKGLGSAAALSWLRPAWGANRGSALQAGVAKVSLTPAAIDLAGLARSDRRVDGSVTEDIYARIILLANDAGERLLLVTADLPEYPRAAQLVGRIAATHRIDPAACLLAVTGNRQAAALVSGSGSAAIQTQMADRIVAGVGEAVAALQPARLAFATTQSNINAPFGRVTPAGLALMPDFANFADKELALLRVDDTAGKTLALFVNYAMQANMMEACSRRLSGDVAGAISAYVERRLGCMCAWSMGAAADSYPLTIGAVENPVYAPGGKLTIERQILTEEITDQMRHYLTATQGLDILNANARIKRFTDRFTLRTAVREAAAAGRKGALTHRLTLAVVNDDIAFAGVNGLPSAGLGKLVKDALPYRSMVLAGIGKPIGIVADRASDPAGLVGVGSVAADPTQSEKIYVDGFTQLAARRAARAA